MSNFLKDNEILMLEYNKEKNKNIDLNSLVLGSHKKIQWKCGKGHEWQAIIVSRNRGIGCPYCAGQKVLKGYNDLSTINPELAKEWNCEENGELKPDMVTVNSTKKVWWRCGKCENEWQATIYNRNHKHRCPKCRLKK